MNLAKEHGSNDDGSQEGITVAIRMRPLNNAEENNKRIWKVLQKYSSITQTTRDGKPLPERTTGRTFFTFDKTFGENTNNKQVYESVAQGIVNSVVDGLNGTIFAYGQTSSGKTYTMQGAGNIEQGMGGEGGVVHMAANDIFSQIAQKQERNFLVRVSFLEIYNEEVRDLLGDVNQTLKIREDPRHGVFVQSQEEIVTNFDGLLRILGRGDKSRTFAATGMNERSSRSHTILRITIESREKEFETEEEEEDDDMMDIGVGNSCGDGSVRISTLNLVDLAGSESVRHTGATGERQKEGGLINQSLLTLSRVIVALGAPNQMHVNFRDSKLTRILQPSLSGNARMAIICCATPSELYLEETRSTLQFASRAKLVKTNAQVNEVLDERSMIRRLQKELAEAKRNQSGVEQGQVRDLEAQVATAGTQAMEAKKKLDRLKASILNTGYIIDQVPGLSSENHIKKTKKRRKSDGHLLLSLLSPEKMNKADVKSPKTAPRRHKNNVLQYQRLDIEQELKLVQEALATRNSFVRDLNLKLSQYSEQIKGKNCDLENLRAHNTTLIEESKISKDSIMDLEETVVSLKQTLDSSLKENEQALAEKDSEVIEFFEKLQQALRQNEAFENNSKENVARLAEVEGEKVILEERISSVEDKLERERESHERQSNDLITSIQSLQTQNDEMGKALERETQSKVYLQDKFSKTEQENKSLVKSLESRLVEMEQQLEIQETVKKQLEEKLSNTQQQTEFSEKTLQSQLSGMVQRLQEEESMRKDLEVKLSDMESLEKTLRSQLVEMEKRLQEEVTTKKQWEEALSDVRQENESAEKNLQSQLAEMEQRLQEEAGMKKQVEDTLSKTQQETESLEKMFQSQLSEMEQQVKEETAMKKQLEEKLETIIKDSKLSLTLVSTEKKQLEDQVQNYQKNMEDLNEKVESLEERQQIMLEEKDSAQALLRAREEANLDLKQQIASTEEQVSIIKAENKELSVANDIATNELEAMKETMENTKSELSKLKEELEKSRKETQSIEKENEAKGSVIGPLKEQIESATAEVHELRDVLSSVKSELENQEAVCAQLSQEKKILESAMGGIEGEMIDKDVTLEQLRKDKEQAAEDHATEAAGYKKEISDLHETLSDTKSKLEHQESEILKVSKDWEALEAHMKEMEDINTAKIATLEELHADKELANGDLEERLKQSSEENQKLQDDLIVTKSKLEQQESEFAQLSEEKAALETHLEEMEDITTAKIATLEELHAEKETSSQQMDEKLKQSSEENQKLQDDLIVTKSKLEQQESEFAQLLEEKAALETHLEEMEDITTAKIATLEELHAEKETSSQQMDEKLKQSSEENQKLQDDLIVTKSKLEQQESEFAQLLEEKAALETHLEEMEDITTAKIATLEELHAEKETSSQQMDEKLKQSSEENQKLQDDLIVTKSKLEQQESEFAQLLEEKAALETHLEEMEDITTAKIATLEELQAARESLSQKMEEELKKAEDLQNILTVAESEVKMLSLEKESLEIRIQSMEDIHASKESVIEELRVSAQEKDECTSKLKEKIEMYRTKIETLEKNFASAEGGEARKDSIIKQLRVEREELQMKLDTKISEAEKLENKATDFECLIGRLSADVEIHNNEIETLLLNLMQITGEKEELESSHVELKYSCESLTTENEAMHDRFSALECKNAEVEEELECLMIEYKKLTERNSALEESEQFLKKAQTKIQKTVAEYEEEVTDLSEQIGTVFNEVLSFEDRNNELQLTIDNLQRKLQEKNTAFLQIQKDIETMAGSRDEMLRNLQNCRAERDEAKNEVKNIINSRDSMIQSLRDREAERDEATSELERLYDEIRDLNSNKTASKAKESELFEEVSELKVQNLELKRLLASVNETEEKLRNALKIAEKENMTKTQELEDAQHRISRIEQELSKSQIVDVELSRVEQSKADLLVSLEIIQREKENIEQSLQEETNARNELQQQMREEQRALIQEGENMMAALRKQLEECETKLNQSESEAYAARKQVEEITDERNRLEEKYLETSTQLSSSDSSKQRQEEEMATLRSKLNDSKSESYALKEAAIDMKEKMRRATRDSEKAIRENEIANSELSTTRRKLVSLENLNEANHTENLKLRKKLKDLEVNETLAKELQKELEKRESEVAIMSNEISCLKLEIRKETDSTLEAELGKTEKEMKMMKNELDEMNELMKQKEKRIKKLEAVRLTKDQLAQIKKMKTDNLQYEKKCSKLEKDLSRLQKHISTTGSEGNMSSHRSHYEQKCLHLEKEIDRLQNQLSTAGSETNLSLEVNELRFDKEALERKLRKFATHCQRLEDDKAGMADALRSCNINIETHGNNVTDAIVHLCDKLASIEEVHDKQLNNSFHEKEKSSLQQKIEKLSHSEEKLTEKLNQYQRDNAKLQEKLEKIATKPASGDSDEHRENIRYLEHENLQLMHDMKSVKRQLQAAREEIETLRMNGIGRSPNSKFGSLDTRASMKHPLSPTTTCSSSKENSDTMELANLAEACTKNILRLSARKTKKRNVLSDNTNGLKDEHREERLADKRRKVIGLADKEKVDRVATNNISTPGLGESSSHSTENTGECKQS